MNVRVSSFFIPPMRPSPRKLLFPDPRQERSFLHFSLCVTGFFVGFFLQNTIWPLGEEGKSPKYEILKSPPSLSFHLLLLSSRGSRAEKTKCKCSSSSWHKYGKWKEERGPGINLVPGGEPEYYTTTGVVPARAIVARGEERREMFVQGGCTTSRDL